MSKQQTHEHTNALINENSPYLLQHAHNPVDWYPWGEEALEKAKKEDKLMIISVGYSACHWCHVMEHESFEDSTVAEIMNKNFINIKVDREERPDVDDVYMTACQLASGRGCGWPLNAFALPDGRPVWAGTYFPKEQWIKILEQFSTMYQEERSKLEEYASQITRGIRQQSMINVGEPSPLQIDEAEGMAKALIRVIDKKKGGREGAPKFPMPSNYEYLLAYGKMTGSDHALQAVKVTLDNMAHGGIYDHLGGGFSRYSVDSDWLVPHFEKMLYDNGQLLSLYAKAFMHYNDSFYLDVIDETARFILRELTSEEGGFYSSLDADSEGEEGKFYVWTKRELDELLTEEEQRIFYDYYSIEGRGNWEHGKNILHETIPLSQVAGKGKISFEQAEALLASAEDKLRNARSKRVRPGLDDKILTSWNALMLTGFVNAYKATGNEEFREVALKNAAFLRNNMIKEDHSLYRNYKDGKLKINAFLDDYALLIQAFIAVYEITFDEKWLTEARELAEKAIDDFYNPERGMFYYTSKEDDPLVARKMEITDNVIPGSNSSMARSLHSLYHFFYDERYKKISDQMLYNLIPALNKSGQTSFYSNWAYLYLEKLHETFEIAIVGDQTEERRKTMQSTYLPNVVYLGGEEEGSLELLKGKREDGVTRIFVCQNRICQLPVQDAKNALDQINYFN